MLLIDRIKVKECSGPKKLYAEDIDRYVEWFFSQTSSENLSDAKKYSLYKNFCKYFSKKNDEFKILFRGQIWENSGLFIYYHNRMRPTKFCAGESSKINEHDNYVFDKKNFADILVTEIAFLIAAYGKMTHMFQIKLAVLKIAFTYFSYKEVDFSLLKKAMDNLYALDDANINIVLDRIGRPNKKPKKHQRSGMKLRSKSSDIPADEIIETLKTQKKLKAYKTLADKYNVSVSTIQRKVKDYAIFDSHTDNK